MWLNLNVCALKTNPLLLLFLCNKSEEVFCFLLVRPLQFSSILLKSLSVVVLALRYKHKIKYGLRNKEQDRVRGIGNICKISLNAIFNSFGSNHSLKIMRIHIVPSKSLESLRESFRS